MSSILYISYSFFKIKSPSVSTHVRNIQRNHICIYAKIKKKTNSKRSFDIDTDPNDDTDDSLIVTGNQDGVDIEASIIQARNNLNSLKVNVNTVKPATADPDSEENETTRIESSSWKETVQSIIKNILYTQFKIPSPSSSSPTADIKAAVDTAVSHNNETSSTPSLSSSSSPTFQNKSKLIKLSIVSNRIEVIISNGACDDGDLKELDAEELRSVHKGIYDALELYDTNNPSKALDVVARYEVSLLVFIHLLYIHLINICDNIMI